MFDFAIAGPFFGLLASFAFFITGLTITSSSADLSLFPAVPVYMLKASAVCGGLTEFYLGNGILEVGPTLPLHPYAISGAVGILANALALLPLGRKYNVFFYQYINENDLTSLACRNGWWTHRSKHVW
jgi:hypothetical protein